jgi:hypothetical protein
VVLYHLFSSLHGILHNISVRNSIERREQAEELLQLREGVGLLMEDLWIEGDTWIN